MLVAAGRCSYLGRKLELVEYEGTFICRDISHFVG